MAATSPYTQNDYQASSTFRPYQLPINDIFRAISAQDQFWKIGAQRVKSKYDDALQLRLSLAPNQKIRDDFMQEAEKQMTKLSTMDLSDPSVQRQGIGLFRPLFQDEGIMTDDAATRHIEKVNNDALAARNKENGKYYSATNHQYALIGATEFKSSMDRMAGKKYLEERKEYEPFYDPSGEINSILKNCKPDKASGESVQGYYIKGYSDESLSAARVNSCLDAGLSDKARRQLEINGTVTYRNNPEALRDKYIPHLQGTRSQLTQTKAAIQGVLANKNNLKNLKKDDLAKLGIPDVSYITPDFIRSLEEKVTNIDDRILNLNDTISKLNSNDFSPIQGENLEKVASVVYSRDYMENVAEGFSYNFSTNTVKPDPVQMTFFKENQMNARQEDDQVHDSEMLQKRLNADLALKMMDIQAKGANAKGLKELSPDYIEGSRVSNSTNSPFAEVEKADSYDQVTQKRTEIATQRAQLNTWLYNQAKDYGLPAGIQNSASSEFQAWWDNFKITAKGDPIKEKLVNDYYSQMDNYVALEDAYRNTQDNVDSRLKPLESKISADIANTPAINVGNTILTGRDIYNAITGGASPLRIVEEEGTSTFSGSITGVPTSSPSTNYRFYVNGQEVRDPRVSEAVRQARVSHSKSLQDIKNTRNSLMQSETVLQKEGFYFPEVNDDKESPFKKQLAQHLALGKDYIDKIQIGQTDANGRIIVTMAPAKKSETDYDPEDALKKLMDYGAGTNIRINEKGQQDANGNSVMLTGVSQFDLIDESSLSNIMKPYIRSLESKASLQNSASTGFIRSGNGRSYRLDVSAGYKGGYTYKVVDQENPTSPVYSSASREDALQTFDVLLKRNQPGVKTK